MYISMIPDKSNKVINASQGDVNRKFEFIPYDYEGLVDISNIQPNPLPSYNTSNGGTETLLPINTSTPSTTPLDATINGEDVYFTERISNGDTQEIEMIKGNTLVWNQLINVNVASSFINFDNGVISLTGTPASAIELMTNSIEHVSNHKYLLISNTLANPNNVQFTLGMGSGAPWITNVGTIGDHSQLYTSTYRTKLSFYNVANKDLTGIKITCAIFDLTLMFGSGNEPTSISDFTNLFPLPYYDYNAGSLLSFNGTGIKSIGFNQWDEEWEVGGINDTTGEKSSATTQIRSKNYLSCLSNTQYYIGCSDSSVSVYVYFYDGSKQFISRAIHGGYYNVRNQIITTPSNCRYMMFKVGTLYTYNNDICINISDTSKNGTYEPYKENTIDLPISTYFPNGMKSAGSIYDELTPSKATTRIGMVDLGSLSWTYDSASTGTRFYAELLGAKKPTSSSQTSNMLCAKYQTISFDEFYNANVRDDVCALSTGGYLSIRDTTYNDAAAFKTAMNGVYLYYELETPTEVSIETATLETNYCSVDLELEDNALVCYTTEELTSKAGRHECKISMKSSDKLSSAKFYLNVESRP